MKTKLLNNLLLKLLSVAAAMVLWLIVVKIDDPITDVSLRNIKVDIVNADILADQGQVYRVVEGTDTVDLTVYARTSVAERLQASDFRATADVQKDLRYDSMVSISVSYVGGNARTEDAIERIDQSRSNVLVSIEESVTEQFKVTTRYTNEPSDGLEVGTLTPEQTVVEITGPKSTVDEIREVVAEVNIAGVAHGGWPVASTLEVGDEAGAHLVPGGDRAWSQVQEPGAGPVLERHGKPVRHDLLVSVGSFDAQLVELEELQRVSHVVVARRQVWLELAGPRDTA